MGGLLLFEGEELVARFRPHRVSYLRRYGAATLWFVPALVAAFWPSWFAGGFSVEWGLAVFIVLALAAGFLGRRLFRTSLAFTWFACFSAAALIVARVFDLLDYAYPIWFLGVLLGGFLVLTRLLVHEADRMGRLHFLTTERLVVRGGLKARRERALSLKKIQEVRSERPPLGQFFDFGDLYLVQSRTVRGGKDPKVHEEVEVLRGIGRLTEVQHNVAQLVQESQMPVKDRRRRMEERRVKESMRRLASWMRRGHRRQPGA